MGKLQAYTVKTKEIGDRKECAFVSVSISVAVLWKEKIV